MTENEKNTIKDILERQGKMVPLVTVTEKIQFWTDYITQEKAVNLSMEDEVNRRVQEELMKRGVINPEEMEALSFTSLRESIFDQNNDDTMPQITEDSRDISPAQNSKAQDMTEQQLDNLPNGVAVKKVAKAVGSQERDQKEKAKGDLTTEKRQAPGKDIPNEEKAISQENIAKEILKDQNLEKKEQPKAKQQFQTKENERTKQIAEEKPSRIKTEMKVVSKETTTIRANDYEGHDVKQEIEKVKPQKVDMDKGAGFGSLSAALARGQDDAKAGNLLQAAVGITAQTGRTTEFMQGNDKLQLRRDPEDGCTYAYINDKKVGGDKARNFLVKMNQELGPEKAEQLKKLVDRAKNEPLLDRKQQSQTVTHTHTKSQDMGRD